jgi:hypothetical protein
MPSRCFILPFENGSQSLLPLRPHLKSRDGLPSPRLIPHTHSGADRLQRMREARREVNAAMDEDKKAGAAFRRRGRADPHPFVLPDPSIDRANLAMPFA